MRVLLLWFIHLTFTQVAFPAFECFVDLPLHDPAGNTLKYELISVRVNDSERDLLTFDDKTYRMRFDNGRLYFSHRMIALGAFHLKLRVGTKAIDESIELTGCRQRWPLQRGQNSTNHDLIYSRITGGIAGCKPDAQWWVRSVPMFGHQVGPRLVDGYVDATARTFDITGALRGVRQILVFGRGKDVIAAHAVDVVEGKFNEVGEINLSSFCSAR